MKKSHIKWRLICKILKSLAYSERLEIFAVLDNKDKSIEQLSLKSNMCQAAVSRHLRVLHNSGLIKRSKCGQQVFHRLDKCVCNLAHELESMAACISKKQFRSN